MTDLTPQTVHLPRPAMWARCDVCRRYAPLNIDGLQEVDYRTKTFSCSQYGGEAYLAVMEPTKEAGMHDYRLDPIELPKHRTAAVDRNGATSE